MSAVRATGRSAVIRQRLAGITFLLVIAGLVGLTVAIYSKAFTPVVRVTLQAGTAGNQLSAPADVKLRGLIVGEVRSISSTGSGAVLDLALDPDQVALIPANVQAQLVPKTLFGEKFVDLVVPETPSATAIRAGDVIGQDRSETAVETEQALNDLLPLLQTLKPQEVSTTLNALSGALRGRGDRIGANLVLVDDYLKGINPDVPALGENLAGLADFSDTVTAATPNISLLLDNLSFLGRSLVDQESQLNAFLTSTTTATDELGTLLEDNETRLVSLATDSRAPLETYARYSPQFPCFTQGLVSQDKTLSDAFGTLQPGLHITLELTADQGAFTPNADEPRYRDDRGAGCFGLPSPQGQAADINFQDGYRDDGPADSTTPPDPAASSNVSSNAFAADPAFAFAAPQGQRRVMGAVLAPALGVSIDEVPDLAYLLFGPMARGTEVGLS